MLHFQKNNRYISSNVLKMTAISRVRSMSEITDIFKALELVLSNWENIT